MADLRADKFLADLGIGTRSQIKNIIKNKKVAVNGQIITSANVKINTEKDVVTVNGKEINYKKYTYIMMNKPAGVISSTEDKQKTVIDLLPKELQNLDLFPVGRLDKDTVGLLILTNDGTFAHNTLSPKKHIDKKYYAKISGTLPENTVEIFKNGVTIGDYKCKSADLSIIDNNSIEVVIHEGKFHQVKRMFEAIGCKVEFLKRISFGKINLDENLNQGEYRELNTAEMEYISKFVGE